MISLRYRRRAVAAGALALAGVLLLALAGCGLPGTVAGSGKLPATAAAAASPTPLPGVQFPWDEAQHNDLTEWWYYTGHLHGTDAQGHSHVYGFEYVIFQTLRGQLPPFYASHFAISDITAGQFHFDQRAMFEPATAIPSAGSANGFSLALGDWTMHGLSGHDTLQASQQNYAISLSLTDTLPHPILHGGNGLINYGAGGFSYYYSRPLLSVDGTLTDHGTTISVSGQAWFDHQWGNFLSLVGSGWNWYSIQLSNHTEFMLYDIFDATHTPVATFGTYVAPDGTASEIPSSAIHLKATGSWTSPVTHGTYPSGWTVTLDTPAVSLTLTPLLKDQELVTGASTGVAYWEGAVGISGQAQGHPVNGEGYVELTGYASVPSGSGSAIVP